MDDLAEQFEQHRGHLRAVAYRLLGSLGEADDAVQETWLRFSGTNTTIDNLGAWLRTVASRVCLDMLRARKARREDPAGDELPDAVAATDPAEEAVLADSVGRALLVVLDALTPAERVAFVLHDLFAVPFDQIAPLVDRTPVAAKKLASRARHRVRGTDLATGADLARQRPVVEAFLIAARSGDFNALLAVLAPDVVRKASPSTLPAGAPVVELRGARAVAEEATLLSQRAQLAELALVNGAVGLVVAPRGRLFLAISVTVEKDRIARYEVISDAARLELAVLSRD